MESEKYSIVPVYIIIKYLHIQTFTFYSNIYVASSLDTIWKMATVNTLQEKRIPREEDSRASVQWGVWYRHGQIHENVSGWVLLT